MITNQDAYNIVAKHLLTQLAQSIYPSGNCVYRGKGGKKCAIGCLIPDELYDVSIEGSTVDREKVQDIMDQIIVDPDFMLLTDLQYIHDQVPVSEWKERLSKTAAEYGIDDIILREFN